MSEQIKETPPSDQQLHPPEKHLEEGLNPEVSPASPETLDASSKVAENVDQGNVPHEKVEELLDRIASETGAKGTLTPKEQEAWREWTEKLIKNGVKESVLPVKPKEKPLFIDEIGFSDYLKTFQQVSRQYGLGPTNPKIAVIEAGFLLKGVVDGLNPVRLTNWAWNAVNKREETRQNNLADADIPPMGVMSIDINGTRQQLQMGLRETAHVKMLARGSNGKLLQSFYDLPPEEKRILALDQLKQWGPFLTGLATLPLSILTNKASEALGDELLRVKENVNKRVADSLLMVDFEFSQSRNPAAMIAVVERGKTAIDTLITHTYRSFLPGVAALSAATIPLAFESPFTAALAGARGLMLLFTGKARLTEAILEGQAEAKRRGAIEGRVMAIMNGLELVKTDDTEQAANELAQQLTARDRLLAGVGWAQSDAEKMRERIGKAFTYGTPIVSVGWKALMEKRRSGKEASVIGASPANPGLKDFLNPKGWKDKWTDIVWRGTEYMVPFWNAYASQEITDRTVNSLVGLYHGTLKAAVRDIRKMEEYLGSYDALDRPDGPRELARMSVDKLPNLSIHVENIAYKNILRGATLEIPEGSFIAVQGVSGEGKSTLLRQMLGLYHPEGGSVTYGGVPVADIKKFGSESLFAKIAYAPQHPYYFPQMTIRENIKLWSRREVGDERIRQTLMSLGMEKFVGRLDDRNLQFSGGELRRIGLARALVKDPKILFLDEPTSNLDPQTSKNVMDIIAGLRVTNPAMTVIAVTHDERFGAIADRVVTMGEVDKPVEQVLVGEGDATEKS